MKLHEYLATGHPVVASPIRSLLEFDGIIELASGVDEWSAALERALGPEQNSAENRQRRLAVAREYGWDVLTRRVALKLCERLGSDYVKRVEAVDAP